jgi:hypothetical protein
MTNYPLCRDTSGRGSIDQRNKRTQSMRHTERHTPSQPGEARCPITCAMQGIAEMCYSIQLANWGSILVEARSTRPQVDTGNGPGPNMLSLAVRARQDLANLN